MKYERYEGIIASPDRLEFKFFSTGPRGSIEKVVMFERTSNSNVYNLSFGNLACDGSIDDETTNDNKDRNKILATVASTVYEFSVLYPDTYIFFCGSTPERTRLYRMALTINIEELEKDFSIYGVISNPNSFDIVHFTKGMDYFGFMIIRKKM